MKTKPMSNGYRIVAHLAKDCEHELLVQNTSGFVHVLIGKNANMRIEQAHSIGVHSAEINISQVVHFFSANMNIVSPPLELEKLNVNNILAVLNKHNTFKE